MKFTIRYDVPREAVIHHVPGFLHDRLEVVPLTAGSYTVLVFAHTRVTTSRLVEKAIRHLDSERVGHLLVIGTAVTAEGRVALDTCGATIVTSSDYPWTDASYHAIRSRTWTRYKVPRPVPVRPDEPPSRRPAPVHVYAVLRIDADCVEPADRVTVKEVVTTAALAESEAARLNRLNGSKGFEYIVRLTRLYSPGTSAGSNTR